MLAPASAEPLIEPIAAQPAAPAIIPPPAPAPTAPPAEALLVEPPPALRRPPILFAFLAGGGWVVLFGWLQFIGPQSPQNIRLLFGAALMAVGLLTWAPLQWATRLPVLTWRGTVGWGALIWVSSFAPPPTERLVAGLPDLPIYLLLFGGVYLASNAVALPLVYVWGRRRHQSGRQIYDPQRARRQAAECSIFITMCFILKVMNILELGTVILLIAILGLSEWVVLSLRR